MERVSDHYATMALTEPQLNQIRQLEEQLRKETNKDVVLIAYEESDHNPT
ncbi:hypothetical protein P4637_01180 [Halalkalibacterium halodurans]|jgi:hypothetical protein|uniref:BH1751 protein n=1 Tax=Halalkalibacterium halodurans (strain ATCC BAA-125 / DSM 18197 / FERM 7344 / JCM 9153 / C-125) TaxID=272558 RepID=Q9KC23_HALH5|nr:hypothetical protein [Halalkalibacterium halodurans]MDY7222318.1 hypothetical protein [Halalkalibacterium halodurans]MDY7241539.1 hypothetical protein [Halalkalibacterium halodurans]MED3646847.1 hypothetical protein [Halalkalibacterium halodurans]MED4082378.1 hypothetical protein [Halalkalibacterium halodurans]MED4083471.1 hypothetical protein [Halalkalibacterium halodurans]